MYKDVYIQLLFVLEIRLENKLISSHNQSLHVFTIADNDNKREQF